MSAAVDDMFGAAYWAAVDARADRTVPANTATDTWAVIGETLRGPDDAALAVHELAAVHVATIALRAGVQPVRVLDILTAATGGVS